MGLYEYFVSANNGQVLVEKKRVQGCSLLDG